MNQRLETLFTGALVAAAIVVAAVLGYRELWGPKRNLAPKLEYLSAWPELLGAGRRIGNSTATIKLIEFADLQCPFCKSFNGILQRTLTKYGDRVELVFVHYPLPMHHLALSAARAAECANDQEKFLKFVDRVYETHESWSRLRKGNEVELDTWTTLAMEAGVRDTSVFRRCAGASEVPSIIQDGMAAAKRFHIKGTPSVIVNGWRFSIPPTEAELHRRIDRILAGKSPVTLLSRLF